MAFELRHCRVLVALADHGSITRASRALELAQSTVSESLLALERAVGAHVTVRGPGPARLSPIGEALLPHARALLAGAEAALAAAGAAAARTPVNVGAVESVSSYVLPDALTALRAQWPDAEVQVSTGVCDDLCEAVARGRLQVALVLSRTDGPLAKGLIRIPLSPARIMLVTRPGAECTVATPAALARATLVLPDAEGAFHETLRVWFGAAQARWPRLRSAGSVEGVKRAVMANHGTYGLLPVHAVRAEILRGDLDTADAVPALPVVWLEAVRAPVTVASDLLGELLASLGRTNLTDLHPGWGTA